MGTMYSINAPQKEVEFLNSMQKDIFKLLFDTCREIERSGKVKLNDLLRNSQKDNFSVEYGTLYGFAVEWYKNGGRDSLQLFDTLSYHIVARAADRTREINRCFREFDFIEWLLRLWSEVECRTSSGWDLFVETHSEQWRELLKDSFISFLNRLFDDFTVRPEATNSAADALKKKINQMLDDKRESSIRIEGVCNLKSESTLNHQTTTEHEEPLENEKIKHTVKDVYDFWVERGNNNIFKGYSFEQFQDKTNTMTLHNLICTKGKKTKINYTIYILLDIMPEDWRDGYLKKIDTTKRNLGKNTGTKDAKAMKNHFK